MILNHQYLVHDVIWILHRSRHACSLKRSFAVPNQGVSTSGKKLSHRVTLHPDGNMSPAGFGYGWHWAERRMAFVSFSCLCRSRIGYQVQQQAGQYAAG